MDTLITDDQIIGATVMRVNIHSITQQGAKQGTLRLNLS
jgi:hypothetical protein